MNKTWFSVKEFARRIDYTERHVRRMIKEGRINAQKVGRKYQIPADQSKWGKLTYHRTADGKLIPIPPIPPDGFIWDMDKKRFVVIEEYAKKHGYKVVITDGRKCISVEVPVTNKMPWLDEF